MSRANLRRGSEQCRRKVAIDVGGWKAIKVAIESARDVTEDPQAKSGSKRERRVGSVRKKKKGGVINVAKEPRSMLVVEAKDG